MGSAASFYSVRDLAGVKVIEFSRSDVTDGAYIKRLGDEIYHYVKTLDCPRIVIDLDNVNYLSSATLGMLIALNKVLGKQDGQLRIANVGRDISEVFRITKLHKVFQILDSTEAAVASLRPA